MPYTAESYGVTDPFDARQNVYAGAQMLSELLDSYDGNATLLLQHIMLAVVQYRSMEECLRMKKRLIISARLMIY
ncbi:MAG: lytic transglycosylase domain-containing protein [Lachnospira eligens]